MKRKYVLDVLWLAALMAYVMAGTPLTPFHGDESTLIYMSRDYAYQFIERDLEHIYYSDTPASPTEQELRLLNGTTSKYLYGLAWHMRGFSLADLNEQWDWGADWDYNQRSGHSPSPALLDAARWSSVLFLAASVGVMFALGWGVGGRPVAYLASLYYALHPVLLLAGRRAMMESTTLLFTLLALLAGMWYLRAGSWRAALLMGLAGGLALASKHTAAFTLIAVFGTCAAWALIRDRQAAALRLGQITAAGLLALLTFYALNPAWWGDPFSRAAIVLEKRENLLEIQQTVFGGYTSFADQIAGFAQQALIALPQYYEVGGWQDYIGQQIAAYEASPWRGVSIGGSLTGAVIFALLVGLGGWALWQRHEIAAPVRWLVSVWALLMVAATLLLTPLEWQRYYVPVYPALGLLAALGVVRLTGYIRRLWRTG